jgi:hypothetical protein
MRNDMCPMQFVIPACPESFLWFSRRIRDLPTG